MICYKDMTFCSSDVEKHTCGRELTKEDRKQAEKIGLPIAHGDLCKKEVSSEIGDAKCENLPNELRQRCEKRFYDKVLREKK